MIYVNLINTVPAIHIFVYICYNNILNSLYVEGPDQKIAAFKSYYEANVDTLISFAQRFVSFGLAEDLVHDVFSGSLELS